MNSRWKRVRFCSRVMLMAAPGHTIGAYILASSPVPLPGLIAWSGVMTVIIWLFTIYVFGLEKRLRPDNLQRRNEADE